MPRTEADVPPNDGVDHNLGEFERFAQSWLPPVPRPIPHESSRKDQSGLWQVVFYQQVNGLPVDGDKPMQAHLDDEGHLTYVLGRRRPSSRYPLRSPADAWQLVMAGKAVAYTNILGVPMPSGATEPFQVVKVELAYTQAHVNVPLEVMQPYYVFRNAVGEAVFVPAVADPHVKWPAAGQG